MSPFVCFSEPKAGADSKRIRYLNLEYVIEACFDEKSGKLTLVTAATKSMEKDGRKVFFTHELTGPEATDAMEVLKRVLA